VQEYLKEEWMKSILESIRTNLGAIPRSWYNIEEGRWDVFNMSKSSKYLTLVRFVMQVIGIGGSLSLWLKKPVFEVNVVLSGYSAIHGPRVPQRLCFRTQPAHGGVWSHYQELQVEE
jgi:hypothetical protein